jgi:hypothetical protein
MWLVTDVLIVKDGSEISEEEITAQIRVLLVAGFETTAGITAFFPADAAYQTLMKMDFSYPDVGLD